mgnify:CR=1 FL=1
MSLGPSSTLPVGGNDPTCLALDEGLRVRGAAVLAVFGFLWALVAASGVSVIAPAPVWIVLAVLGGAASIGVLATARRRRADPVLQRARRLPSWWSRGVGLVNIAEVVAIFAVVALCRLLDAVPAIPGGVALAVGAHFVPLATAYDQPQYSASAAGLAVVALLGVGGAALGAPIAATQIGVGYACAVVLWLSALHVGTRPA